MRIALYTKKGLVVCFLMCAFVISAHAQNSTLTLKNGKAAIKRTLLPRKRSDAHFYFLKLRKGQIVEIKVDSNTIYLDEENACGVGFELFDPTGERMDLGDAPDWFDRWQGEIKEAGNYKIKVYMGSLMGGVTATELRKKKPVFKYTLTVQMKKNLSE